MARKVAALVPTGGTIEWRKIFPMTGLSPLTPAGDHCDHGAVRPTSEEFRAAWPRVVRALAAWSGSLDDAEEYAAEAISRAVDRDGVDDLAAWCVQRRQARLDRRPPPTRTSSRGSRRSWRPEKRCLPTRPPDETARRARRPGRPALRRVRRGAGPGRPDGPRTARGVRAEHRPDSHAPRHPGERCGGQADPGEAGARAGPGRVPGPRARRAEQAGCRSCSTAWRACSPSPTGPGSTPPDALTDMGRQALSIADALVALFPDETEVRGLRAVIRLGLARRPGRVDADGVALTLDEMDRSGWDPELLRADSRTRRSRRGGTDGSLWRRRSPGCTPWRRPSRAPTGQRS